MSAEGDAVNQDSAGPPAAPVAATAPGAVPVLELPLARLLGQATADQLAKRGVDTGAQLLRLLPRRYDTWGDLTDLSTLVEGEQAT